MLTDIIMATYNGEKYIENQILSLLQQTHQNWKLYIHDDGSSDNTIKIIKKYAQLDDRIQLIEDEIKGLKAGKNFLHTLQFSTAPYAIFCDQDDIWLENKLEELLCYILPRDISDKPVMVYCDGYSYDNEEIIFSSISTNHANQLKDFIFFNSGYQGCSILMNKTLIDFAKSYNGYIYHHDDLVSLIAHSFGSVYFLPKKLMLYRQHAGAVTGSKNFNSSFLNKLINNSGFVISRKHYSVKSDFYKINKDILSMQDRHVYEIYLKYCNKRSKIERLILILFNSLTFGGSKFKLISKTILQRLFDQ